MQNFKAYEQRMDSGAVQVALEGAGAQIFIAPGSGFKLYSAIYENRQMLMPTDEPLQMRRALTLRSSTPTAATPARSGSTASRAICTA